MDSSSVFCVLSDSSDVCIKSLASIQEYIRDIFFERDCINSFIPSSGCPDTGYPIIDFSHFILASNVIGSAVFSSSKCIP